MIRFRLVFFFCLFSGLVKAQNFRIQIAAFADSVNQSYFTDRGVDGVITVRGGSGIWQYVFGNYATREEAEVIQDQLIAHGFSRPVIQDLEADRVLSELNCAYTTGLVKPRDDEDSSNPVRTIFFEDGQSVLDEEDRKKLDKIYTDLVANPSKKLRIMGFTDNKGSAEDNLELSGLRAKAARNYLINKGIKAVRLFVEVYGESDPLYDNRDINGNEIPENQRWNNRVMMKYSE